MHIRPFSLERYFARHEFSARRLMGSSDPEAMTLAELLALEPGSAERLGELWLGYTGEPGGHSRPGHPADCCLSPHFLLR